MSGENGAAKVDMKEKTAAAPVETDSTTPNDENNPDTAPAAVDAAAVPTEESGKENQVNQVLYWFR